MKKNLSRILKNPSLKKKIVITLLLMLIYNFLAVIPLPWVNSLALESLKENIGGHSGLLLFSSLMGGGLERFSIILLGLSPYINASIIIQLLTVVVPRLEEWKKEGPSGQKRISQLTRILTVPLALAQSFGMILLLNTLTGGVPLVETDMMTMTLSALTVTAGTVLLMWLGELVNESGIGNGISLIIFAGVLAAVPATLSNQLSNVTWDSAIGDLLRALVPFLILLVATLVIIYIIIKFTEGYRKIPLIYTRTGRDERSHFPIRVNQAGMIPIIFAVSVVTFPYIMGQWMINSSSDQVIAVGQFLNNVFDPNSVSWWFILLYFLLVIGFSFFYVSITFNTDDLAENIQKRGGYIPGVRPGVETSEYLSKTSAHLNFFGGTFLALIAVFPYLATKINQSLAAAGIQNLPIQNIDFLINGAGLIICVGVILELLRRVNDEVQSYDYKKFY